MSVQSQFDQEVIDMLPKIKSEIKAADSFEANQMRCKTIQYASNSNKAIIEMSVTELKRFQDDLLAIFRYNEWIE